VAVCPPTAPEPMGGFISSVGDDNGSPVLTMPFTMPYLGQNVQFAKVSPHVSVSAGQLRESVTCQASADAM
jgi:hypothetical protein